MVKQLGINTNVEKVLLHGVGCSGGLAAIRTAAQVALGSSFQNKPARILVLACEVSSLLVRSELESIDKDQTTRIGVCLFSDCASSCILSNGVGEEETSSPIYELLGWKHEILDDTENDLGFDVDPLGMEIFSTYLQRRYQEAHQAQALLTDHRLEGRIDTKSSIGSVCRSSTCIPGLDQIASRTQPRESSYRCRLRLGAPSGRLNYNYRRGASYEPYPRPSPSEL